MRTVVSACCAVLILASISTSSDAEACSGIPCIDPAASAPAHNEVVPQNARALVVTVQSFMPALTDAGIELWAEDAGMVPVEISGAFNDAFVVPQVPLAAGARYALRYGPSCAGGQGWPPVDSGTIFEVPFTVSAPAPLPTQSATISIASIEEFNTGGFDSCGGPGGRFVQARLRFVPTEEMKPWLPVARWRLLVDGTHWSRTGWGALSPDGTIGFSFSTGTRNISHVHAQCPSLDAGFGFGDQGVRPGRHNVRVEAEIAGFDGGVIGSETIEVPLLCASEPPTGPGALAGYDDVVEATGCGCSSGGGAAGLVVAIGVTLFGFARIHHRSRRRLRTLSVASHLPPA